MMKVWVDDKITLESWTIGSRAVVTRLELEGTADEPIEFGIDPKYLIQAMNEANSVIEFNHKSQPIKVNDNALVMPKHYDEH
jgi:hypothetical protein